MNIITPIVLILASVGVFFGYINPAYTADTGSAEITSQSIKELQSLEKGYTDALNKAREVELFRDGLRAKFNNLKPIDIEKLSKLLPDNIDSVRLIIDINNIAAKYGMSQIFAITLSAPGIISGATDKKNQSSSGSSNNASSDETDGAISSIGSDGRLYGSVKLGFSVSGTYENFLQFLNELEDSLRVVDIISLSFGASKSTAQSGVSQGQAYSMTIRTYYLK